MTRSTTARVGAAWLVWVAGAAAACGPAGDGPPAAAMSGVTRAELNATPRTSSFVIEADNSIRIQAGGSVGGGEVGARGTTGPYLSGNVAIDLLPNVQVDRTHDVIADSVRLGPGVTVGDVQTNHFTNGTGASHGALSGLVPLPALPALAPVTPGTTNLTVAPGATAVASTFSFATVSLASGATLRLPGGTYQIRDVTLAANARLEAQGPVQLRIANRLAAASGVFIGARTGVALTANDIRIEVSGLDGGSGVLGSTPLAIAFASGGSVNALILAPRGTLQLGPGGIAKGAFLAKDIDGGGTGAQIVFQDGFANACTAQACDDGNPCTTDACGANGCTHANVTEGTSCDDGNACTRNDACHAGACTGGPAVVCAAPDACHTVGACVPATGCPAPTTGPDGTTCDDGDACTQIDVCVNGSCAGGMPLTCVALDQCHVAGTCDRATGVCSTPNARDGTLCSDGDACTLADACQNGACVGQSPMACLPIDACHVSGVCDRATGACSNPAAPAGAACPGGNVCDGTGACVQCLGASSCPGTDGPCSSRTCTAGVCGQVFAANGAACGTGLACDGAGACIATCTPTTCAAQAKNCGSIPDGCGGTLSCGSCPTPNICGATNVCQQPVKNCEQVAWTRQLGSTNDDDAFAVATDFAGNVYVTGRTQGLDGVPSAGFYDAYLIKYDAAGNRLWIRQFGSSAADQGLGVAVSPTGSIYVTGVTEGAFAGNPLLGVYDIFVAQFDANGNMGWGRQFGTIGGNIGYAVATDAAGNAFVAGETSSNLAGGAPDAGSELFVLKLDVAGNLLWTRQFGATNPGGVQNVTGRGVALDATGNVFVTGWANGGSFDGHPPLGDTDVVLVKLDGDGNKLWSRQYGSSDAEYGRGAAADAAGNVYVVGQGYASLDGNSVPGYGSLLLIKYDGDGNRLWTRERAATGFTEAFAVAIDASGGVFVTGYDDGALDGNPSTGDGSEDLFVAKYDTSGNWIWSYQLNHLGFNAGLGIVTNGDKVFVAGAITAHVTPDNSSADIYLSRLDQTVCGP